MTFVDNKMAQERICLKAAAQIFAERKPLLLVLALHIEECQPIIPVVQWKFVDMVSVCSYFEFLKDKCFSMCEERYQRFTQRGLVLRNLDVMMQMVAPFCHPSGKI